jgi:predicted acylesterase/phospholipase RssA
VTADIDVVISGAGSNGPAEEGAMSVLRRHFDVRRAGGASAGAINAVAECAGLENIGAIWERVLTRGDLEDWHFPGPLKPLGILRSKRRGMMGGEVIREALTAELGKMRMGDLKRQCRIVVGNMATRETEVIDSKNERHKFLTCVDVLCATSAVPFLIDAQQIDPLSPTLYTDGGVAANVPASLFDDVPSRPTVVLRFANSSRIKPVHSLRDFASAIFDLRQDAANRNMRSEKAASLVYEVVIQNDRDSLDLSLDAKEVAIRRKSGIVAAQLFVSNVVRRVQ